MTMKQKAYKFDYVLVLIFLVILVCTLYPFLNVLAISLNDPVDTLRNINMIIPRQFTLNNYQYVFTDSALVSATVMSVLRTVIGTVVSLLCTAMLGYALSRKDYIFHRVLTILFVIPLLYLAAMFLTAWL